MGVLLMLMYPFSMITQHFPNHLKIFKLPRRRFPELSHSGFSTCFSNKEIPDTTDADPTPSKTEGYDVHSGLPATLRLCIGFVTLIDENKTK